jgi:hypothetical protein
MSLAATLGAKVGELTQLVRNAEHDLGEKKDQLAKGQDLLDRDIRELARARDLYIAEIYAVSGSGETNKTYGHIFYFRGKRLVFYAYDLDAQHGVQEASTFQAWGRRGPDTCSWRTTADQHDTLFAVEHRGSMGELLMLGFDLSGY